MTLPKAIIVDLDGTLCDHSHRLHYVDPEKNKDVYLSDDGVWLYLDDVSFPKSRVKWKPNWEAFFEAMGDDGVNEWCSKLILSIGFELADVIFITGRPEKYRETTLKWLRYHLWPVLGMNAEIKLFIRPDFIPCSPFIKPDGTTAKGDIRINKDGSINRGPDNRPAHEVKREIYEREVQGKYDVLFVIEDSPECVAMYRSLGLTVLDCGGR